MKNPIKKLLKHRSLVCTSLISISLLMGSSSTTTTEAQGVGSVGSKEILT